MNSWFVASPEATDHSKSQNVAERNGRSSLPRPWGWWPWTGDGSLQPWPGKVSTGCRISEILGIRGISLLGLQKSEHSLDMFKEQKTCRSSCLRMKHEVDIKDTPQSNNTTHFCGKPISTITGVCRLLPAKTIHVHKYARIPYNLPQSYKKCKWARTHLLTSGNDSPEKCHSPK